MGYDPSGFKKLYHRYKIIAEGFPLFLERFLTREALRVLAKNKRNTPVGTGYLRNNWQLGRVVRKGDVLEIAIYNPTHYASYIEYGHRTGVKVAKSWYGFTTAKSSTGWYPGHFMCTISIKEVQRGMPGRYDREFKNWISKLSWGYEGY